MGASSQRSVMETVLRQTLASDILRAQHADLHSNLVTATAQGTTNEY